MSFLGGWNPMSSLKSFASDFKRTISSGGVGSFFGPMGMVVGAGKGYKKDVTTKADTEGQAAEAAARKAAHDAEVAQLAQNALGSIALRRRRGSMATQLTGSSMGSNPGSSGKTLLSQ